MPDIFIEFISEEVDFTLKDVDKVKSWIDQVIVDHQFRLENITYIFCSDEYLYNINQTYLNHDTLTDIITFDNSDEEETLESDIFISIDRVKENASQLNISFTDELHRVIIHGVLHLMGYDDKEESSKAIMRQKEDKYLSLRDFS
ncbi:rRNA maturation RNase YbeY [Adhaeribacter arboris]|uniref:Endoribonuclease YbeY n=1 Tax=Adhaeribacter arboris TaxID=2072846 RepID=A0A2T2YIH3_9BACT|nr:rRNA maturation RNase YbeY [Adhaeribacter arboris]PSR55300.1 rRNA maturation RNase YbeY [Adhaeribacter arboris]